MVIIRLCKVKSSGFSKTYPPLKTPPGKPLQNIFFSADFCCPNKVKLFKIFLSYVLDFPK